MENVTLQLCNFLILNGLCIFFSENIPLPATSSWAPSSCLFHRQGAARSAALDRGCSAMEAEAAANAVASATYYDFTVYIFPIFIR